jgi:RNA polymerase sigma-70 factor (ECF subfamily)
MNSDTQTPWPVTENAVEFPGTVWLDVTDRKKVIQRYLYPLKVYLGGLLSRFPDSRNDAEDYLQDFISEKILKPGWLEKADPGKGKFRDFLKSSLRNSVIGEVRRREAEKRGGKNNSVSLDELEQEVAGPEPYSDSFDLAWLQTVLAETLERMEKGCEISENGHLWKIFQARMLQPILEGTKAPAYEELVERFGFKSPAQATNALATAKRMFARHLRDVVAQYETGDQAIKAELDAFRVFLDKSAPNQKKHQTTT